MPSLIAPVNGTDAPLDVFLHIAKTAGTSFNTLLTRAYGRERIVHVPPGELDDGARYVAALPAPKLARLRLVRGHIVHGLHRSTDRPVRYFTILREPLGRLVSDLNHMASEAALQPDDRSPWYQAIRDWTDAESYAAARPRSVDNPMVRAVSGITFPPGQCSEAIFETAIANLHEMAGFGVYEHLAESIVLLRRKMRWRALPVVSRRKSGNPARITLTDKDRAFLTELNEYDARLYRHVRSRIEAEIDTGASIALLARLSRYATPAMTRTEDAARQLARLRRTSS